MLSVQTNVAALNAYRNLSITNDQAQKSMQRLSSGFRINSAADDAAGLAISTGLGSQISGMSQAVRNTQDGISVVQTASGALNETTSILQRMRDLGVQAANDSQDANSRADITTEVTSLTSELTRIAGSTSFNGIQLLNKSAGAASDGKLTFQVGSGDNTSGNDAITVDLGGADVTAVVTGLGTPDLTTATGAQAFITALDTQIQKVSTAQATLGATQNRFQHTINNLNTSIQNTTEAQSRIRDTDMAQEMTNFSKSQILVQAGTAMLAQANQSSQGILKLLG
jgi:flagellin